MRALLLARKSNKVKINDTHRGDGLSLETQDESARAFSEAQGWTVIDAAGDTVSGRKVKPRDRKTLGPWLTDPALVGQWDVLVAARGDRISRERIEHWSDLEAWAVANGKTIVVVERGGVFFPPRHEGDSYNWTGIKSMAGNEWDVIRGRIIDSQCRIMRDGFWCGRAPFGYTITGDKYRKTLVVNESLRPYVEAMFTRCVAGESLQQIASWLTAEAVPTERGLKTWNAGTVRQVLVNDTYAGEHERGCAECGSSHTLSVPAIVDAATIARAATALAGRRRGDSGRSGRPSEDPAALVPVCRRCEVPMYRSGAAGFKLYNCKRRTVDGTVKGCGQSIPCKEADALAGIIMAELKRPEEVAHVTYPAADLENALAAARKRQKAAYDADDMEAMLEYRTAVKALEKELESAPRESVTSVPTGRTLGDAWKALEPRERRAWMWRHDLQIVIAPASGQVPYTRNLKERVILRADGMDVIDAWMASRPQVRGVSPLPGKL